MSYLNNRLISLISLVCGKKKKRKKERKKKGKNFQSKGRRQRKDVPDSTLNRCKNDNNVGSDDNSDGRILMEELGSCFE